MKMNWTKYVLGFVAGAALMVSLAAGASAQNYNSYYGDERFNQFLANHPSVQRDLSANPNLINDPNWRRQHPDLQQFLQSHKQIAQQVKYEAAMQNGRWGAYDEGHQWHDSDWWRQNHPNWFWQNHPEWANDHPKWRQEDGAMGPDKTWHDRGWWYQNNPNWVKEHRPTWEQQRQVWEHHDEHGHH